MVLEEPKEFLVFSPEGIFLFPEKTIKRRYVSGLKNFFNLYRPLADSWQFYDNSNAENLSFIASEINQNNLIIENQTIWTKLLETYTND
jgi:predicted ABC-type ATPase